MARRRPLVCYIGSDNPGNAHGLEAFIEAAWPIVRERHSHAELRIHGKIVRRLRAEREGVTLIGPVHRVATAYTRARVVVNPVTRGTGLKIKTLECLAHGRALVTTSCGAAGMEAGSGTAFICADRMDHFGREVADLLEDDMRRRSLEAAARAFVRQNYDRASCLRGLLDLVARRRPRPLPGEPSFATRGA